MINVWLLSSEFQLPVRSAESNLKEISLKVQTSFFFFFFFFFLQNFKTGSTAFTHFDGINKSMSSLLKMQEKIAMKVMPRKILCQRNDMNLPRAFKPGGGGPVYWLIIQVLSESASKSISLYNISLIVIRWVNARKT